MTPRSVRLSKAPTGIHAAMIASIIDPSYRDREHDETFAGRTRQ